MELASLFSRLSRLVGLAVAAVLLLAPLRPQAQTQVARVGSLLREAEAGVFASSGEAQQRCRDVIELLADTSLHAPRMRALMIEARILIEKAQFPLARQRIDAALATCEQHLGEKAKAAPLLASALWHARRGAYRMASQDAGAARKLLGDAATPRQQAEIKLVLARAAVARGEYPRGLQLLYEIQDLVRDLDLATIDVELQLVLSRVALHQGDFDAAAKHGEMAERLIVQHGYDLLAPIHAYAVAMLAKQTGAPEIEQRHKFTRAVELAEATGHATLQAEADRWRGNMAAWVDKDPDSAIELYLRGLEKAVAVGDMDSVGNFVLMAADALRLLGRPTEAIELIDAQQDSLAHIENSRLRSQLDRCHGAALAASGRYQDAYNVTRDAADRVRWLVRNEYSAEAERYRRKTELAKQHEQARQATIFWGVVSTLAIGLSLLLLRMHVLQGRTNRSLEAALSQVQELRGLLPICAQCKSIRDDAGYWHRIESYLTNNSKASLSHGICPGCATDLYPDLMPTSKAHDRVGDSEAG